MAVRSLGVSERGLLSGAAAALDGREFPAVERALTAEIVRL